MEKRAQRLCDEKDSPIDHLTVFEASRDGLLYEITTSRDGFDADVTKFNIAVGVKE